MKEYKENHRVHRVRNEEHGANKIKISNYSDV